MALLLYFSKALAFQSFRNLGPLSSFNAHHRRTLEIVLQNDYASSDHSTPRDSCLSVLQKEFTREPLQGSHSWARWLHMIDLIPASVYRKYSIGPCIRPIYTRRYLQ